MTKQSPFKHHVKGLLDNFCNQMLGGLIFFAVLSYPMALMQWQVTGFLPIYGVYTLVNLLIIFTTIMRNKLSVNYKGFVIASCFALLGLAGTYTYGLASGSLVFVIACSFFCSHIWGRNIALIVTGIYLALLCVIAALYIFGILDNAEDLNSYVDTYKGWLTALLPAALLVIVLISTTTELLANQKELAEDLFKQKVEVEHLANHDKLTGLPSLRLAEEHLEKAISDAAQHGSKAALLYLDLDGFKGINDNFGHDAGDHVLVTVAQRLKHAVRNTDSCCRIGGDEFLIIIPEIHDLEPIRALCQRLINSIQQTIRFKDNDMQIGISIGVALYPDNAHNAKSLRKSADEAMYQIKNSGKNNFAFSSAAGPGHTT